MYKKLLFLSIIIIIILSIILDYFNFFPKRKYLAKDFNIEVITSEIDYNNNRIDDYTDILNGAKKDAQNMPKYKSTYYKDGYPTDDEGVCTDVIWRAFLEAGYSLKDMIDNDIANHKEDYNIDIIDPNIDFRRVKNIRVFFDKYALSLTTDINKIADWMPGDIVIFGNNKHIGIISNYRNSKGIAYVIHNKGQFNRDQDYLDRDVVSAHYRFDASKINENILK